MVAPAASEEDMNLPQRETAQPEVSQGLPPLVRTQRWTWTATTLKSAGKKLRPPARRAASRTWSMLKKQRTKPQPALPESEWARQVYRRHAFLKAQGAEEGTLSPLAASGHEATPPVQIIRSGSARSSSSRRSSKEQGSDMGPTLERSRGTLYSSPLLTTSSASARESEEEEEANPENSGPLSRFARPPSRALDRMSRKPSYNPPGDVKGRGSPVEAAEEEAPVVATATEARRNFDKRRSMYYYTLELDDDEEDESSEDETSSEAQDDDSGADDGAEAYGAEPENQEKLEVFFRLQDQDKLHRNQMVKALEALGFTCPQDSWINDAWKSVSPDSNTVEIDHFIKVVRTYEEGQNLAFATAFRICDKNNSGVVECSDLSQLLFHLNMEPMSHVLNEVTSEVDTDGLGTLNMQEFKTVMQLILSREGFTKSEFEEFHDIFERFDRDKKGECETSALAAILTWLGFAWSKARIQSVVDEVDVNRKGKVNQREFIVCMRKVREEELQHVKQAMSAADRDGDGTMSKDEMPDLLKGLGYDPWDVKVIIEAQKRACLEEEDELDLGQVWQVLQLYRRYEGFSEDECGNIARLFDEQEKDETGELRCIDAPKALRALGYKLTFEAVQSIVAKVDVDDTGTLNLIEFRKMIRMLQERESNHFRNAMRKSGKGSQISIQAAQEIGRTVGCQLERRHFVVSFDDPRIPNDSVNESEVDHEITEDAFTRACCNFAQEMRETFQLNGGFSDEEVTELKNVFDSYDSRKTGKIANKELVRLVDNLCPSLAREKALRPQLQQMMQACQEFDGSLCFQDFLKLMRLVLDFQDKERAQKELSAIKTTGFTQADVQDLRELFLQNDEGLGVLYFEAVRAMFNSITPLGDNLVYQLEGMFSFVTRKKVQNGLGRAEELDFSEFHRPSLRRVLRFADVSGIVGACFIYRRSENGCCDLPSSMIPPLLQLYIGLVISM